MTYDPGFDPVGEAQQVFRRLLNATAWPGRIERLPATRVAPPAPWPPAIAQIARTLLDAQVSFAVPGAVGASLSDYLVTNTGARAAPLASASYVIAGAPLAALAVSDLYPGTLLEPDRGATLVLACDFVVGPTEPPGQPGVSNGSLQLATAYQSAAVVLALRGRGVAERATLRVDPATAAVMEQLAERGDEYPLGVDLILADPAGRIASLPRTTGWSKEGFGWAT
jgi:alpha-D-ribose 1-methylphosphonate 5-triphosphate synthase subunit PhnH